MYAVSRRYRFDVKHSEEIDAKVRDEFMPMLRKLRGFFAYYWFDNGNGTAVSLTVFKHKAGATASIQVASFWVKQHLAGLLGTPDAVEGEIKAYALADDAHSPPDQGTTTP